MSTPHVRFRLPDGRAAVVHAGGILGRLATATLRLDEPRVSEVHAYLSLRDGQIHVLALRGSVSVRAPGASRARLVREAPLEEGTTVELVEGLALLVEAIAVPLTVPAVEVGGVRRALIGDVMSLVEGDPPGVVSRFVEGAPLHLWTDGGGWRGRLAGNRAFDARAGAEARVPWEEDTTVLVRFVDVTPSELGVAATTGQGFSLPIRLRVSLEELRLEAPGRPPLRVGGVPARIVHELAVNGEPVPWKAAAAAALGADEEKALRDRWDRSLKTLRRKLYEYGYRDVVRSDGHGYVSLAMEQEDVVEVV